VNLVRSTTAAALAAILIAGCGGSSSSSGATSSRTNQSATSTPAAVTQSTTSATTASSSSSLSTPGTSTTSTFSTTATLAHGFHLTSPAFAAGGAIPAAYTCDGTDVSPPLQITGIPPGTRELVLVMRDPDSPGAFVHWALAGIPPTTTSLPSGGVPGLVAPGRNSFGTLGYRGPCPPHGASPHHYVLTVSALSAPSGLRAGFSADQLSSAATGISTLIGTYARR
jgi:Raf kinase inhibitor-like YbhB/YbcL family protein